MTPTSTGGQLIYKRTHFTWHRHIPGMKSRLSLWSTNRYRGRDQSFVRVAALNVHADGSAIVDASSALSSKFRSRVHRRANVTPSHTRRISLLFAATFVVCAKFRLLRHISLLLILALRLIIVMETGGETTWWKRYTLRWISRGPLAHHNARVNIALPPPLPFRDIRSWLINRALRDARNYERGLRAATNQP